MKRVTIFLLTAILLCSMLLCACQKTETEPDTELTTPDTTASETNSTTQTETDEPVQQPYDPEAAGEIPPWETALQEEEFIHTWNPTPTLPYQSFRILRFGEKYTDEAGSEAIREDDWIVETRNCLVIMRIPEHWQWDGICGTEGDEKDLRFTYEQVLYRREGIPSHWTEYTTDRGKPYYGWEIDGTYHFAYPTRIALVDYWFELIFYSWPTTETSPTPEEYYDTYVQPMAESVLLTTHGGGVPLEIPEPMFIEHTYSLTCNPFPEECPLTYQVSLRLPEDWKINETIDFDDSHRIEAGCLVTMRMSEPSLCHDQISLENYERQITPTGLVYYTAEQLYRENDPYVSCLNQYYYLPLSDDTEHLLLFRFVTYPAESDAPDPDDYYNTHILPIIDSVKLEIQQ